MGRGHTNTQTHRRTSRLLDRIGPVGRFGENRAYGRPLNLSRCADSSTKTNETHINRHCQSCSNGYSHSHSHSHKNIHSQSHGHSHVATATATATARARATATSTSRVTDIVTATSTARATQIQGEGTNTNTNTRTDITAYRLNGPIQWKSCTQETTQPLNVCQ